ncbi:hypothetical protein ACF0H5_014046 [Mactra antiquata]
MSSTVTDIEPLREKTGEGIITGELGNHGYIDGDIFYDADVLTDGYQPRKWDAVSYTAVESEQGRSSWRAISVERSQQPQLTNLKVLHGPLQKSFTQELMANKEGIVVTETTDFGTVPVGNRQELKVWVKNTGNETKTFLRCHLAASSSQIQIKKIELCQDNGATKKCSKLVQTGENVVLDPTMSLCVSLMLDASLQGQEKHLMVVTFEGFKIGRYITASITDPYLSMVEKNDPYVQGQRHGYSRYRNNVECNSTPWMVPGERPTNFRNKLTVQYSNRLPKYNVPDDLKQLVLNHENLIEFAPVLLEDLSYKNYREKFKLLLHLEEIQMDIDIREFDLHRVCLRHAGEYLGLSVPGLAEGRPSVLIGDLVILSDPTDPSGLCFEGYVHEVFREEVLIKFNPDFHRTYTGKDYNVEFTFNRGSLRKCHKATEMALNLGQKILFPTEVETKPAQCFKKPVSMSTKRKPGSLQRPHGTSYNCEFINPNLNARQRSAVIRIVQGQGRPLPYILFGPPGTGKTITVVEAILQVFTRLSHSRIIACAPSNSAADLIAERLHQSGLVSVADMVRLNAFQRSMEVVPESIVEYCTAGDNTDLASRYRIIISTCVSAGIIYTLGIKPGHFTHVFIDEAGQATEPEAMISSCLVSQTQGQIILAGDPQQLGPVLMSKFAKTYGLQYSLLERLINTSLYCRDERKFSDHGAYDPLLVTKLVDNYRSHKDILSLPSRLFYNDELIVKADPRLTHTFCKWNGLPVKHSPVIFHGVRGEDFREGNSPSWFNPMETVEVVKYLQSVLHDDNIQISCDDIGVITPYRKQVEKIRLLVDKLGMDEIKVGSVEEFQGQERQVIIISTVRSNEDLIGFDEHHTLGFLSNPKRFNVAITRAQALLIVIGNPFILTQDKYWRDLITYCVELGAYRGCDLPPTSLDL